MSKARLLAFYLPQFYPTPENDEWWGPGFTEWTNVAKAKPLFKGHDQPRIPRDLGFYDLRVSETREKQAQLAREAGIEGFCYWHYWFAGRRMLDQVFREVVEAGKPDFPFCLCWANHSWYAKTWDPNIPDKLLIEQTYPGEQDYINHFNAMLPAFKDSRYMKVDGKLIFGVFDSCSFSDFKLFSDTWNELARKNGLDGFYFFGFTFRPEYVPEILKKGYDSVVVDYIMEFERATSPIIGRIRRKVFNQPNILHYDDYANWVQSHYKLSDSIHPCINPNFDHSPRSRERGVVICDHSPSKWEKLCKQMLTVCDKRVGDNNLLFIKAWNEWGEGNYLEPDMRFGKEFIESTRRACNYNIKNDV